MLKSEIVVNVDSNLREREKMTVTVNISGVSWCSCVAFKRLFSSSFFLHCPTFVAIFKQFKKKHW